MCIRDRLHTLRLESAYLFQRVQSLKEQFIDFVGQANLLQTYFFQALIFIIAISATLFLCQQAPGYLNQLQRKLYRGKLPSAVKLTLINIVRYIKPNSPWLIALILSILVSALWKSQWSSAPFYLAILKIYIAVYFSRLFLEWCVDRSYDRSRILTSISLAKQILDETRKIAILVLVLITSLVIIEAIINHSLLLILFKYLSFLVLWIAVIWYFNNHINPIQKLVKNNVTLKLLGFLKPLVDKKRFVALLPFTVLLTTAIDLTLVLHQKLLNFQAYQRLSAQWFRLRLDMVIEDDTEASETTDTAYERWFSDELPVEKPKTIIQLDVQQEIIKQLDRWWQKNHEENALIITADQGMGRSTLLTQVAAAWDSCEIKYIKIDKRLTKSHDFFTLLSEALGAEIFSFEALLEYDKSSEKVIIILDNLNRSFLSEVGCFEAVKTLIDCTNTNTKNMFWLLSASTPSWHYLSHVLGRSHYIFNRLSLPRWSMQNIKSLIITRHEASRRKLHYNDLLLSTAVDDQFDSISAAETRFFHLLWQQSNGNPAVALNLWCGAAKPMEKFQIQVNLPPRPATDKLAQLADDQLFVLKSIVQHGLLSIADCISATHLPETVVRRAVKVASELGCLQVDDAQLFSVEADWYYPLTNFLYQRNMLHG